jgi:antitoxin ParD1/3/4
MNVSLTKKQEEYIANQIASGDYQNASELVRDALRMHQIYREKVIADLRKEIQKGLDSGYSNRSILDIAAEEKAKFNSKK